MNDMARMMMNRHMRNDYAHTGRGGRSGRGGRNDGRRDYARYDRNMMDGRRGVKGTGPYGIGGRLHYGRDRAANDYPDYNDYADYGNDYRDYGDYGEDYGDYADYDYGRNDYADYGNDYGEWEPKMKLKKRNISEWEHKLRNADGSKGMHFNMQKVMNIAERMGIRFNNYSEKEFAITMNMLYSDYCEALKSVIPPDKEDAVYAKLAKAWLEDEDAPEASEKLALYYYCVVCADEE